MKLAESQAMVMQLLTIQGFEAFAELPENAEKTLEPIGGEIVEKMPTNPYGSYLAARILIRIGIYLLENDIGYVTGEAGGYGLCIPQISPLMSIYPVKTLSPLVAMGC